jgi:UPF0755 protein
MQSMADRRIDRPSDRTIDPLIKSTREEKQVAENWHDDPWDIVVDNLESSVEPRDFREIAPMMRVIVTAVVCFSLFLGAIGLWYLHKVNPSGGSNVGVSFTVNDGDSVSSVSSRLESEGIITSAGVFRWYVGRKGGIELTPGYYTVKPHDHMGNIMKVLSIPPSATFVKVTFPEGFTVSQMAKRLAEKTLRLNADLFTAAAQDPAVSSAYRPAGQTSLEGLLFPDTYRITGDESEGQVVERMVQLMERVGRQEGLDESKDLVGFAPYKTLIIASMIEREAKTDGDRAKIARVIYNRLELGMKLQIDATLYYAAPEGSTFTQAKELDTPYNTYLYKGLTPTPIANPGRASISAALHPAQDPLQNDPICKGVAKPCRYLFYVLSDKDGSHAFAATLAQHEANIEASRAAGLLP